MMKINKKLLIIAVITLLAVFAVACGGGQTTAPADKQESKSEDTTKQEQKVELPSVVSLATKEAGSRSYTNFVPLADVISKYSGMKMNIETIGGIGTWSPLMERGDVEFGQEEAYGAMARFRGIREFQDQKPATYMRQVLAGYPAPVAYMARADAGIEKFEDMAGKTFFTDSPGVPVLTFNSDVLLEKYGVADKVTRLKIAKAADAAQQVIEGRAAGFFYSVSGPAADMDRAVGPMKIIPMTQEDIDDINAAVDANVTELFPAAPADYLGIQGKTDVPTSSTRILLLSREDVPDEVIYAAMEAVYSNYEELSAAAPQAGDFTLENGPKSQVMPFHPGAVKFYQDKGVWTDELEQSQQRQLEILEELKKK